MYIHIYIPFLFYYYLLKAVFVLGVAEGDFLPKLSN